jgi:hypothetical protein
MVEFVHVDDVLVLCWSAGAVTSEDWAHCMKGHRHKPISLAVNGCLGTVELTSLQRKEGGAYIKEHRIKSLVITDDRIVRGLATAVSWVGADVSAFAWDDLPAAMKHVEIDQGKGAEVINALLFLRRGVERQARKAG